jgi:hypothetical protein
VSAATAEGDGDDSRRWRLEATTAYDDGDLYPQIKTASTPSLELSFIGQLYNRLV